MPRKWIFVSACFILPIILLISGCSLVDNSNNIGDPTPEKVGNTTTQRGTIILQVETNPSGQTGSFTFTGVPTGTITIDSDLVVTDLNPGTYTTTQVDPAPDFDVTSVECNDGASGLSSSGDAQSRTAVINLDDGETVTCTFSNTQRGTLVVASRTIPDGAPGQIQFTGVPSGTIPTHGTLVVSNLEPGTYTTTEADPAPNFNLGSVDCDDGASSNSSSGDPSTRSAVFNLDPGEFVTCTFTNIQRGTAVIASQVVPEDSEGIVQYTGVPSGTIQTNGTLVVANLEPGTYTSTQVDPEPDFELKEVYCDDTGSGLESSGDPQTRSAIFNIDPGEMVTCTFINVEPGAVYTPTWTLDGGDSNSGGDGTTDDRISDDKINPFDDPDEYLSEYPIPDDLPSDAGTYNAPKPGPWTVTHFQGKMECGDGFQLAIPASSPENGVMDVLDQGQTVIGTGIANAQEESITMQADQKISGRYTGSFNGFEQGVPVTVNIFWQLVTDEYIVGFLTANFNAKGVSCNVYRSFEIMYIGD
jgi:hypothetical protein